MLMNCYKNKDNLSTKPSSYVLNFNFGASLLILCLPKMCNENLKQQIYDGYSVTNEGKYMYMNGCHIG